MTGQYVQMIIMQKVMLPKIGGVEKNLASIKEIAEEIIKKSPINRILINVIPVMLM